MIPAIKELNFPEIDGKRYATLTHATANIADMGEKTISAQVKIDGDIVPDFTRDWEVEFQGEKYIMPLRVPQGSKGNDSLDSIIELTFQHWAVYQLKRWPFVTIQPIEAGTYMADEEEATVSLNLKDFCILFGQVLEYYYGEAITIDLNPEWQYDATPVTITISHTLIWNVLTDALYGKYGVRWVIEAASDNSNTIKGGERYVIRVGYPTAEVDHIFEYGFEGGLLKIERQVQSDEIRNMLKGRGGDTNIPFRYFKNTDPNNKDFKPDPDWAEELANIYFPNLMPATFRSYVQGWKAAHISKYPGYTAVGEANAYAPWAYRKGYTDTKFRPVEFVADEITIEPGEGDRQVELLPGYSPYVKKGSSLDKYGPLAGTLDNNEDIYPTIQGTGKDIVVAVEQIESNDVAESTENDAKLRDFDEYSKSDKIKPGHQTVYGTQWYDFSVPSGKTANLVGENCTIWSEKNVVTDWDFTLRVYPKSGGAEVGASGIPEGDWRFKVDFTMNNPTRSNQQVVCRLSDIKLMSATLSDKWRNTFDIWVKDIWGTVKQTGETDAAYSERVWKPILGDREGETAKVLFTTGALAHEDYEFTIVDFPVPDTNMTWEEKDSSGNVIATHTSHWRIKLAKSEAELEATGLYVPSTRKQGKAGDRFVFIGTEMTHEPYVVDAEIRLDDWKEDQLGEKKEIKPTFVVTTDRIRMYRKDIPDADRLSYILTEYGGKVLQENGGGIVSEGSGFASLLDILRPGNAIRLADKRFIQPLGDRAYETLYLQSITYTYREPSSDDAALNPDVEIVLGDEYATAANPVTMMQGEISALQRQVGSISNIEQIVRAVGDKLYMRKDGIPARSLSPTQFFSLLTSGDFRAGLVGGAGWGFFRDETGNWILEVPRLNVRERMSVNNLVINQVTARGGMIVESAAAMEFTRVETNDDGDFVCYFDTRKGSVANLFQEGDVAYCNRWTAENAELKFYKREVVATDVDSVTLSLSVANGEGVPAEGDVIVHYGSYIYPERRYVKVRDVVGGGYERYIEGLDSVFSEGTEYYYVGRQAGANPYNGRPRFFLGDDAGYIEYINGELNIKGRLNLQSTVGTEGKTLGDVVSGAEAAGYSLQIDNQVAGVACDAEGNPTGALPRCQLSVWHGTRKVTDGVAYSVEDATGVSASVSFDRGLVTFSAMTADTATVSVRAEVAGVALTGTISLYKQRPGADGGEAVVYSLLTSVGNVLRDADGKANPGEVECSKYRTDSSGTAKTGDMWLYVRRYCGETPSAWSLLAGPGTQSGSVAVADGVTAVEFELRDGSGARPVVLGMQMVRVLTDASGLLIGGTNLLTGTNRGTEGWIANTSADGKVALAEMTIEGTRGLQVGNLSSVVSPQYRMLMREVPSDLFKSGKRYTLSFDAWCSAGGVPFSVDAGLSTGDDPLTEASPWHYFPTSDPLSAAGIKRVVVPLTGSGPGTSSGQHYLKISIVPGTEWQSIYIGNLKLEEGNVATEWSPAPTDPTDYITASIRDARKESGSFDGGLILATLMRLGFTDSDGIYKVRSGISGIADRPEAPAIWTGGDMVDAENNPSGLDPATAMLRHNGTGYFCGNTIRMEENRMEVGRKAQDGEEADTVVLDDSGLSLNIGGNRRLAITNAPVGDDFPAADQTSADLAYTGNSPVRFARGQSPYTDPMRLYVSEDFSVEIPITDKNLVAGTQVSFTISFVVNLQVIKPTNGTTPMRPSAETGQVRFELLQNGVVRNSVTPASSWEKVIDVDDYAVWSRGGRATFNTIVADGREGAYSVRVRVDKALGTSTGTYATPNAAITRTGSVRWNYASQTVLGNDGLLSIWDDAALLVKQHHAGCLVGNYGLKATDQGFFFTTTSGKEWKQIDFTKIIKTS